MFQVHSRGVASETQVENRPEPVSYPEDTADPCFPWKALCWRLALEARPHTPPGGFWRLYNREPRGTVGKAHGCNGSHYKTPLFSKALADQLPIRPLPLLKAAPAETLLASNCFSLMYVRPEGHAHCRRSPREIFCPRMLTIITHLNVLQL